MQPLQAVVGGRVEPEEDLERTTEVLQHPVVQHRLVPRRVGQRRHLGAMECDGGALGLPDVVGQGQGPERRPGRVLGVAPVPQPDGVLPQRRVRAARGHARGETCGVVVGVAVVAPGGRQHGAVPVLADDVDERCHDGVGVVGDRPVGQAQSLEPPGRREQPQRLPRLLDPVPGELLLAHGGGVGVRPLAVREQDDDHLEAGPGREGHQAAGSEGLVIRVGRHDDQPAGTGRRRRRQRG